MSNCYSIQVEHIATIDTAVYAAQQLLLLEKRGEG
jgi:hypothetical protein